MNYHNNSHLFIFTVSIAGIIALTAILSSYEGKVMVRIGCGGIQFQIEGNAHRK